MEKLTTFLFIIIISVIILFVWLAFIYYSGGLICDVCLKRKKNGAVTIDDNFCCVDCPIPEKPIKKHNTRQEIDEYIEKAGEE